MIMGRCFGRKKCGYLCLIYSDYEDQGKRIMMVKELRK